MNIKNDGQVVINGKTYTISGYENSEYFQKVASHINEKMDELKDKESYSMLDADMKNILLAINLSDDYFKLQQSIDEYKNENDEKEKEMFDMKHDMISMQNRIEEYEKQLEKLKKEKSELEHENIRLKAQSEAESAVIARHGTSGSTSKSGANHSK